MGVRRQSTLALKPCLVRYGRRKQTDRSCSYSLILQMVWNAPYHQSTMLGTDRCLHESYILVGGRGPLYWVPGAAVTQYHRLSG